jgi:transposase
VNREEFEMYVGIDIGHTAHQVCVLTGEGTEQRAFEHSATDLSALVEWLGRLRGGDFGRMAVGIEVPRGAVVESLLEKGAAVFAINPKQLDRFRDRHTVAGAKDDSLDAFVLADSLRTDLKLFRRLEVEDPWVIELREASRSYDELQEDVRRLCNRLLAQLQRYWPQLLALCPGADEPWLWELLERAPTPNDAARLRPAIVRKVLKERRIRRLTSDEVLQAFRAPALQVAAGTVEGVSHRIQLLLPRLRVAHQQLVKSRKRLEALLDDPGDTDGPKQNEHRDVDVLRSLPGMGTILTATMLAEGYQPLRERNYHELRKLSGVAPVRRQTGKCKKGQVIMRRACNQRLRDAMYCWAERAVQYDLGTKERYARLRARGHGHARALRSVGDQLLRTLFAMLRDGTLHDRRRPRAVLPVAAA